MFDAYTNGQPMMEGKQFVKLFKDNNLLDKALTTTDLDITFARVKAKTEKKITFGEFVAGLKECATKKKLSLDELAARMSNSGPEYKGTKAEAVDLHDDKSKYTGVYAKGGPTTVDKGHTVISDLSELADRSNADVRGVKKDSSN